MMIAVLAQLVVVIVAADGPQAYLLAPVVLILVLAPLALTVAIPYLQVLMTQKIYYAFSLQMKMIKHS